MDQEQTVYEAMIAAVKADPAGVIKQRRTDQLKALSLTIPDELRAKRRMRRTEYEKFEACMRDIEKIKVTITLAVKSERDSVTNKPLFPNKESREAEVLARLQTDPVYNQRERMRRNMYSQVKYYDEEIDYLERMDHNILEILAMTTAEIEFQIRVGDKQDDRRNNRTATRAARRARVAAGDSAEAVLPT